MNGIRFGPEILDDLYDGVYVVDRERRIVFWNRAAEKLTGYKRSEVVGRYCFDNILDHVTEDGEGLCHKGCPLAETIEDGQSREKEIYLHHKDGHRVPVVTRIAPTTDGQGRVTGAIEIFSDNSPRLAARQRIRELEEMAMLDELTRLPNRRYIAQQIKSRLEEQRRSGWQFGIVFLDLDHFKNINDTYGHDLGDQVLKMVSRTLERNSRPYDIVGRWGGEEFLGILPNVDELNLEIVAERYRTMVSRSAMSQLETPISVTISIGATMSQPDDTLDSIVQRADQNMYQAKQAGRNRVVID